MKRLISLLLAITMIASLLCTGAWAEQLSPDSSNEDDPVIAEYEVPLSEVQSIDELDPEEAAEITGEPCPEVASDSDSDKTDDADLPVAEEASEAEPSEDAMLTWQEYLAREAGDSEIDKEAYCTLADSYDAYRLNWRMEHGEELADCYGGTISNDYLEFVVANNGKFSIGTVEGNPNYASDNYKKLLYGHPSPRTSETLIKIGNYETLFSADSVTCTADKSVASMYISAYDVTIVQTVSLAKSGNAGYADTVKIQYTVVNNGSSTQSVGIRIMLDTMLANNDDAPFKITGTGNVTTCKTYTGDNIPKSYQVYDNLDNPTTLATGYLYADNERKPDKVQFCNWGGICGSSWSHSVTDGSNLGDSAVGIYFNPVSIAPGKSTNVSTYYGVSVGAISGSNSGTSVKNGTAQITVINAANNKPLSDVTVSVSGGTSQPVKTDSNGVATISGISSSASNIDISLKKDTYKDITYTRSIKSGSSITLYMKNDDRPLITSVYLGSKDILSETVHYVEDSNGEISKQSGGSGSFGGSLGTVTIKVKSDTDGCVYYLIQDEKVLQKNETGEFKLKTLSKNSGTLIESLSSQGNRYVKCVSPDGKTSIKYKLGIKVSIPTVSGSTISDLKLGEIWPGGNSKIAKGTVAALFLGDSFKFGPDDSKLKLKVEITEKSTVRVGVNISNDFWNSNKKGVDEFKKLSKAAFDAQYGKTTKEDVKNDPLAETTSKLSVGNWKANFTFYGYGEGQLQDGRVRVDLVVCVSIGVSGSVTQNFFYVVPLYINVGAELKGTATIKANLLNSDGFQFKIYSGTVEPAFKVWLEGGVGTKGVANLGVEGSGKINLLWNFMTGELKSSITAEANLKLAFWKFEKTLNLAKATFKLYDSNDKVGTIYGGDENIWEELENAPFQLVSRNYLTAEETASGNSETDTVLNNAYEESNPMIVPANGTYYKFWIYDDTSKQVSNSNTLMFSKLDNGYWTEATPVLDDGTSDFYFDVASANNKLYVVWHNSNQTFDDATVQPDDMTFASEIYYAEIDCENDDEISAMRLTNDSEMDSMPAITVNGNTAYVAWYHTANGVMENELPNYVYYTTVRNMTAGDIESADYGNSYISAMNADMVSGKPVATFALNDSDEFTEGNQRICSLNLSDGTATEKTSSDAEQAINNGNIISASIDGTQKLFWYENGNIAYADGLDDEANYVFDAENLPQNLSKDFIIANSDSGTYAIWPANEDSESTFKVAMASRYENGSWSEPYKLTDLADGTISSMTAYDDEDGNMVLSYMAVLYGEGGELLSSSMNETTVYDSSSLSIANIEWDADEAAPGKALPLNITVYNTGNTTVNNATVEIGDYETELTDLAIKPGEVKTIEITDFTLENNLSTPSKYDCPYEYDVVITPEDGFSVSDTIEIGYVDFSINQLDNVIINNNECAGISIKNNSGFDAENVHLRVLADATDGTVVYDEVLGTIEANGEYVSYVNIDELEDCTALYAYVTTDSLQDNIGEDGEEELYYQLISLSHETIYFQVEGNLDVQAETGGSASFDGEASQRSGKEIQLHATPDEGYVFDRWTSEQDVVFADSDNADTTMIMPEGDTTVVAHFVKQTEITDISLSDTDISMDIGQIQTLTALLQPTGASGKITWSSDNTAVAAVYSDGTVRAISAGTTTITASCGSASASCQVAVSDVAINSIRMIYPTLSLSGVGDSAELEALLRPLNASESVRWESMDESVATVDENGTVTATGIGDVEIRAVAISNPEIYASCEISVINTLASIEINPESVTVMDGGTAEEQSADVEVVFVPENASSDRSITWENMSEDLISITSTGENNEKLHIESRGECGDALIKASTPDGLEAWCTVHIAHKPIPPTAIVFDETTTTSNRCKIDVGRYYYIGYSFEPYNAEGNVEWSSNNTSVATVDSDGTIYGRAAGKACITAKCGDVSAKFYVQIMPNTTVVSALSDFQSEHNYSNNMNHYWVYTDANAKSIKLKFSSSTEMENSYDYIIIYDADGNEVGHYTGTDLAGKTITVTGKSVKLYMHTDSSVNYYGFQVTAITPTYATPKLGSVSNTTKGVKVSWDKVAGAEKYRVIRKVSGGSWTKVGETTSTSFTDTTAKSGTTYIYSVRCVNAAGTVCTSSYNSTGKTIKYLAPISPTLSNSSSGITVKWSKVAGASGYYVYRKTGSGSYSKIATIKSGSTVSYTDTGVKTKNGTTYTYKVCAYNGSTLGSFTAKKIVRLMGTTISSVANSKSKSLTVKWTKDAKATGYQIQYSTSSSFASGNKTVTVSSNATVSKTISSLTKGKKYYVRIRTYKTISGVKYYSGWSTNKSVSISK